MLEAPGAYRRQGLYYGTLEMIAESMVDANFTRCISFGQFVSEWDEPTSAVHALVPTFEELLEGFHPARLPVLWRVLCLQHLQNRLFLDLQRSGVWEDGRASALVKEMGESELAAFDWRCQADEATEQEVNAPFDIARTHLEELVRAIEALVAQGRVN